MHFNQMMEQLFYIKIYQKIMYGKKDSNFKCKIVL